LSARASPRAVGAFVLGAILVAVLGIVVFGRGLLLGGDRTYVVHFNESLKGLRVGAPVTFRGVDVGQVQEIRAIYEPATGTVRVPVVVALREGALALGAAPAPGTDVIADLVRHGLMARLDLQSLVTGQLLVGLDFHPERATKDTAALAPNEIPSLPSTWGSLQKTTDSILLNVPEIERALRELTMALTNLLSGPTGEQLRRGVEGMSGLAARLGDPEGPLTRSLAELPGLLQSLQRSSEGLPQLTERLDALADASTRLVATTQELIGSSDSKLRAVGEDVGRLVTATRRVAEQTNALIAENRDGLKDLTQQGVPEMMGLVEDATRLVNELSGAVRDMRQDPPRFFFGDRAGQGVNLR
jgi:paraquat-inducible protein B